MQQTASGFVLNTPELKTIQEKVAAVIGTSSDTNIVQFLDAVTKVLSNKLSNVHEAKFVNHSDIYRHVLREFSELSVFYDNCQISSNLSEIKIAVIDICNRRHEAVISVDLTKQDEIFCIKEAELPDTDMKKELLRESASLRTLYDKYMQFVELLQDFFDTMHLLDENFWVVDPEKPSLSDIYRRIVLSNK